MTGLRIRWSLRDLRARWLQVLATAAILAVGAGAFAGMSSLKQWRIDSLNASLTAMHHADLRIDLGTGENLKRGALAAVADRVDGVALVQERLVAQSQVAVGSDAHSTVVPARLVGVPGSLTGSPINSVAQVGPHRNGPVPAGQAILDWNFANFHDLPSRGRIRLARYGQLKYSATGLSPQYLLILGDGGVARTESSLAVVYLPLATVQRVSGQGDGVNQLLVRSDPGQPANQLAGRLRRAVDQAFPGTTVAVTPAAGEPAPLAIERDAGNDQKTNTLYALLLVAGAAMAAFMLVNRVVDAQRRETGIGMALGASWGEIARRPIVLGVEVGLLAAAVAVPFGLWLAAQVKGLMTAVLPLPVEASRFPVGLYLLAVAIALLTPLIAALLPVRRSLKMRPVDAISTVHRREGRGGWLGPNLARLTSGSWNLRLAQRNLLLARRRTVMTVLGLAVVITAVIGVLAMVDSVVAAADDQRTALIQKSPDRLKVALPGAVPEGGRDVRRITELEDVRRAEPVLSIPAKVSANRRSSELLLDGFNSGSTVWQPIIESGSAASHGILLSSIAAEELGVKIGDEVRLELPRFRADGEPAGSEMGSVRVAGIHSNPIGSFAYANDATMGSLGLGHLANRVDVVPEPGRAGEIQRSLFGLPSVTSVTSVRAEAEALKRTVDQFTDAIRIVVFMTLALGLLVSFTSVSLTLDERRREFATLFAFGVVKRSARNVALWENLIAGVLGTCLGILLGLGVGWWTVHSLLSESFPDVALSLRLGGGSIALALGLGIGATVLATLTAYRRVARMDVPSTLSFRE